VAGEIEVVRGLAGFEVEPGVVQIEMVDPGGQLVSGREEDAEATPLEVAES